MFNLWALTTHAQTRRTIRSPPTDTSSLSSSLSSHSPSSLLRLDWTRLSVRSDLAQSIATHQSDCRLGRAEFRYRNRFGLGSDLHLHAQAICNAMAAEGPSYRVWTRHDPVSDPWIFWDQDACGRRRNHRHLTTTTTTTHDMSASSSMECYFVNAEPTCPNDNDNNDHTDIPKLYRGRGRISHDCQERLDAWNVTWTEFRRASMEFLFSSQLSPVLVQTAQQMALDVFGPVTAIGKSTGVVPKNLITVHIRWGDKGDEMELVSIQEYIRACHEILKRRNPYNSNDNNSAANIYLATTDPKAVNAMRSHMPESWTLFVDPYVALYASHRREGYNSEPQMARTLRGQPGRMALASLLVALEANDFVLTTASNWSLLLNELRLSVLETRNPNSTSMVDLRPARA